MLTDLDPRTPNDKENSQALQELSSVQPVPSEENFFDVVIVPQVQRVPLCSTVGGLVTTVVTNV